MDPAAAERPGPLLVEHLDLRNGWICMTAPELPGGGRDPGGRRRARAGSASSSEPAPTAQAAAAQLGCEVGAIANSLIFPTDAGEPLLIMTSGAHRVDLDRMVGAGYGDPAAAGPRRSSSATTPASRSAGSLRSDIRGRSGPWSTGRSPATRQLWAAGGIPHAVFPLSYAELIRLTGGEEVDVN